MHKDIDITFKYLITSAQLSTTFKYYIRVFCFVFLLAVSLLALKLSAITGECGKGHT